jgi:hypothetical protein
MKMSDLLGEYICGRTRSGVIEVVMNDADRPPAPRAERCTGGCIDGYLFSIHAEQKRLPLRIAARELWQPFDVFLRSCLVSRLIIVVSAEPSATLTRSRLSAASAHLAIGNASMHSTDSLLVSPMSLSYTSATSPLRAQVSR